MKNGKHYVIKFSKQTEKEENKVDSIFNLNRYT